MHMQNSCPVSNLPPSLAVRPTRSEIIEITVSQIFDVPRDRLRSSTRDAADIAEARQIVMYLAHVTAAMPLADIGRLYGRDRTTVMHACSRVEDRRDEPRFNRTLDLVEGIVARLARLSASQRSH